MSNDDVDWEIACADAYQAVGTLVIMAGLSLEHPDIVRLLDVLAYGRSEDGIDLLPWPKDPGLLNTLQGKT